MLEKQSMTINVSGEITDPSIENNGLSTPKVILHFFNEFEDRRIPMVIHFRDITHMKGKCMFWGEYSYRLDYLFWKTRGKGLPFKMYMNISYCDLYEEKIPVDLTPKEFIQDELMFVLTPCGNYYSFESKPAKIRTDYRKRSIIRRLDSILKFFTFLLAIPCIPFFILAGLLTFTGFINMPKKIEAESKKERLVSYVMYRVSQMCRENLSMVRYKRGRLKASYRRKSRKAIVPNRITFYSARRDELSGNFEFVYNKLKDDPNLDIKFYYNTNTFRYMTKKQIKEFGELCATSKVIVLDEFTPQIHLINLKPETKLVQLWHACGAFKTFGFSRLGKPKGSPQPTRMHRSYDYVTVSSDYCKRCHSEGFGIPTENVVPTGIARTDIFFDEAYKKKVSAQFYKGHPNFKGKKIVLFAPTFRGNVKETANYPMHMFDLEEVCKNLKDDYNIIIKHHPFIQEQHPIPEQYADRVIDLSESTEINDLLFVTDVIITDYSSLVFEASLLNIPMVFFAYDLESYIKGRDFYFDFKRYIPGKICDSMYDVVDTINNEDYHTEKIEEFRNMFYDDLDGHSSERIAELIKSCLEN